MNRSSCKAIGWFFGIFLLISDVVGQNGGLRFTVTDLGTFGGTASEAWAINDSGTIVGSFDVSGGGRRCFILRSSGALVTFDGTTKPPKCKALAIDVKGNVAGAIVPPHAGAAYQAFRYDGTHIYVLPNPPGYDYGMGLGISGTTVVGGVGSSSTWGANHDQQFWFSELSTAVKWDVNGVATTIVTGAHDYGNYARGINTRGEVVGRVYRSGTWDAPHPWLWQNGVFFDLQMPPNTEGTYYGQANAINENGHIAGAGGFETPTTSYTVCVELWNSHLPANQPVPRANCSGAFIDGMAISSDDWVVGYGDFSSAPPFLSVPDANCPLTDLSTLLDSSGAHWSLLSANGINKYHQIVGSAVFPKDGTQHAVLLTPNGLPLCFPA